MSRTPRLLVVSQVLPFPGRSGQQQRVRYSLQALRAHFHITFVSAVPENDMASVRKQLSPYCDKAKLLPARYTRSLVTKVYHKIKGEIYALRAGLKFSNYIIGHVELTPSRLAPLVEHGQYDLVLFEYWHAFEAAAAFQQKGIPCVLDTHNVLAQSFEKQLAARSIRPSWWKQWAIARYTAQEEAAWRSFDALIAINASEHSHLQARVPEEVPVFYTPMGIDLAQWPYGWQYSAPPNVAYYGGLGSPHNQRDAQTCYDHVMPRVWDVYPEATLWLIGSNPPPSLRQLGREDERVKVTGFVERVQNVLTRMTVVVCPWSGTYGFRSRLVEVMALGVPVVTTPDAVQGMNLVHGQEVLLGNSTDELTAHTLRLLDDVPQAREQSTRARQTVEALYSVDATYGALAEELVEWLDEWHQHRTSVMNVDPSITRTA